jgi:hypothetical protein
MGQEQTSSMGKGQELRHTCLPCCVQLGLHSQVVARMASGATDASTRLRFSLTLSSHGSGVMTPIEP